MPSRRETILNIHLIDDRVRGLAGLGKLSDSPEIVAPPDPDVRARPQFHSVPDEAFEGGARHRRSGMGARPTTFGLDADDLRALVTAASRRSCTRHAGGGFPRDPAESSSTPRGAGGLRVVECPARGGYRQRGGGGQPRHRGNAGDGLRQRQSRAWYGRRAHPRPWHRCAGRPWRLLANAQGEEHGERGWEHRAAAGPRSAGPPQPAELLRIICHIGEAYPGSVRHRLAPSNTASSGCCRPRVGERAPGAASSSPPAPRWTRCSSKTSMRACGRVTGGQLAQLMPPRPRPAPRRRAQADRARCCRLRRGRRGRGRLRLRSGSRSWQRSGQRVILVRRERPTPDDLPGTSSRPRAS